MGKFIGGKYQFKPDSNPPVGAYDVDGAFQKIRPQSSAPKITRPSNGSPFRSLAIKESGPDGYDGHIKPFGSDAKKGKIIGGKYKFVANNNPAPGTYNIDEGYNLTKPKATTSAKLHKPSNNDVSPHRTLDVKQAGPDAYDAAKPFGA